MEVNRNPITLLWREWRYDPLGTSPEEFRTIKRLNKSLRRRPFPKSAASLTRDKLKFEEEEQRHWRWKLAAPYITALLTVCVTVLGVAVTYIHEKNAEREQLKADYERREQERAADKAQTANFISQLNQNEDLARQSRDQAEKHHQEELFVQAVGELGDVSPMQRVAAVYSISQFAKHPEFRKSAVSALSALLQRQTDPSTDEALYKAFDSAGEDGLRSLVSANLQAQNVLARSYGEYVGIELAHKFPGGASVSLGDKQPDYKDFERQVIIDDPVATVYYHRRPLEELLSHDFIRDAFWLHGFPDTQREIFDSEKNGAWRYPPQNYEVAREESLKDLTQATRYLEITSSIIESLLKEHSGKVAHWDLRGVYLVVADLRNLDLRGLDLGSAHLQMADLRNSNLSGSDCTGVDFDGANFAGAKLIGVNLRGADLSQSEPFPIDTNRGHVYTYTAPGTKEQLRFEGADFRGSSWRQAKVISDPLRLYLSAHY